MSNGIGANDIGSPGEDFRLRGYKVEQSMVSDGWNKSDIQICNFSLSDSIQFRWLQTSTSMPLRSNLLVEELNSEKLK